MKELSIEEKAKRYDEALARANEMIKAMTNIGGVAKVDDIQHLFPELKESEDEKIRKALVKLVKKASEGYENVEDGVSVQDAIAWLEKQCEKGINGKNREIPFSEQKPNPCGNCGIATNNCQNFPCVIRDGEQKSTDKVVTNLLTVERAKEISPFMRSGFEQKPAWSEEDETKINYLIALLQNSTMNDNALRVMNEDVENWLKFLRPQSKQEWSKEDKNMLQSILDEYKSMPTEKRNWLKSLKNRCTWKPSDEQMRELSIVAKGKGWFNKEILSELLEQLKKLKG